MRAGSDRAPAVPFPATVYPPTRAARLAIVAILVGTLGASGLTARDAYSGAALIPFASAGDESGLPEAVAITGAVQDVAEDKKSFRLKAPKGPFTVTWAKETRFEIHERKTLGDVEAGTTVHILAEPIAEQPATGGGNFPPQLIKVQAIVVGAAFAPGEVPAKLVSQRIRWVSAKLERREKELYVDGHLLGAGATREVLVVKEGTAGAPEPKSPLFVAGHLSTEGKSKNLAATEILRIAADYPSYELTHDLRNRKPKPAARKKEEFGL